MRTELLVPITNTIERVQFRLNGSDDNRIDSVISVQKKDLFRPDELPHTDGLYSPYMGTTDVMYRCATCGHTKEECHGHEGLLVLKYPVISPLANIDSRSWLKMFLQDRKTLRLFPSVRFQ